MKVNLIKQEPPVTFRKYSIEIQVQTEDEHKALLNLFGADITLPEVMLELGKIKTDAEVKVLRVVMRAVWNNALTFSLHK